MGDMNIDLLKSNEHGKTNDYVNTIISNGFLPHITKPTRIATINVTMPPNTTKTSATLIDHIYSNIINSKQISGIIITDVADHFATIHAVSSKKSAPPVHFNNHVRSFSEKNIITFKAYLNATCFDEITDINCPCRAYDKFMKLYSDAYNSAFPLRV